MMSPEAFSTLNSLHQLLVAHYAIVHGHLATPASPPPFPQTRQEGRIHPDLQVELGVCTQHKAGFP
jgi:hypothetical protein